MAPRTIFTDLVPEGSTRQFSTTLKDYLGVVVPLASLASIHLTLRDVATGAIVNGRNGQDVKNTNGGAVHATSGLFTMVFDHLDTASLSSAQRQDRLATFKVVYANGHENHEVQFTVFNMADVP